MARADAALDVDTGGGEVLAEVPHPPKLLTATEGWPPNVEVARRTLRRVGATVVAVAPDGPLPFRDASFDLVVSRHPVRTDWAQTARVLRPGGTFLSQQIGAGTMRELSEAILGPLPPPAQRHPEHAVGRRRSGRPAGGRPASGHAAGDLRRHRCGGLVPAQGDLDGARVHRGPLPCTTLRDLHHRITREGPFVAHAQRFLIEATRP